MSIDELRAKYGNVPDAPMDVEESCSGKFIFSKKKKKKVGSANRYKMKACT